MARIAGVDLPRDKRIEIGLSYIYGIGRKTATEILKATGVNPDTRVRDLTEDDVSKLEGIFALFLSHLAAGIAVGSLLAISHDRRRNSQGMAALCNRLHIFSHNLFSPFD